MVRCAVFPCNGCVQIKTTSGVVRCMGHGVVLQLSLGSCLLISGRRHTGVRSGIIKRAMEKKVFPEWELPMAARPKEEETNEWPGVSAPGVSPVATGATGAQHHPVADGGFARLAAVDRPQVARLPKYSGATQLEPYLAQFRIAALHYGWSGDQSATQLALALEGDGSAVQ